MFDDDPQYKWLVSSFARTTAHEAAHTFGLKHILEDVSDDERLLGGSDLMFGGSNSKLRYLNLATRWDGFEAEVVGAQNSYEVLSENVGLWEDAPAYVTGTGAYDVITINATGADAAQVTVSAYADDDYSELIETQTYTIDTSNGVTVEAGRKERRRLCQQRFDYTAVRTDIALQDRPASILSICRCDVRCNTAGRFGQRYPCRRRWQRYVGR